MALSVRDRFTAQVEDFHRRLAGHRRYQFWPDVPKSTVNLGVCATPHEHTFESHAVTLKGRKYNLEVLVCKACPLAFANPRLPDKKK